MSVRYVFIGFAGSERKYEFSHLGNAEKSHFSILFEIYAPRLLPHGHRSVKTMKNSHNCSDPLIRNETTPNRCHVQNFGINQMSNCFNNLICRRINVKRGTPSDPNRKITYKFTFPLTRRPYFATLYSKFHSFNFSNPQQMHGWCLLWFRSELEGPKFATFWPHAGGAAAQDRKSVTFWATFTVRIAQVACILDMS